MTNFAPPPGMSDVMPDEIEVWHDIENAAHKIFPLYAYAEMRTPILEYMEVFIHGLGKDTDVVQKEMYTLQDRGGRNLALRPEGTAGIIRGLASTDIALGNEKRVYYMGPMFRGERPAAGRKRQFHQIGVENAGKVHPELDAECIYMLLHYLDEIGISGHTLLLSTRATPEDRKPAEIVLKKYFEPHIDIMCQDCKNRFQKNLWRILDCKNPACGEFIRGAPNLLGHLGENSRKYFEKVCSLLEYMKVPFTIEPRLVRGLDYYVHTVFELTHPGLGGQNAIAGGGRYQIAVPGAKKPIEGIGFAAGMERLIMAQNKKVENSAGSVSVYIAALDSAALESNASLANNLRRMNISVLAECEQRSMKAALRGANRHSAKFALISGENEIKNSNILCKNMADGSQSEIPLSNIAEHLSKLI